MYRFHKRPYFAAAGWLALCGLLLQLLAPVFHRPPVSFGGSAPPTHLCAMGMAMPDQAPVKTPVKKPPPCPICQTLHQLQQGFFAADAPASVRFFNYTSVVVAQNRYFIVVKNIFVTPPSRAPPVLA